MWPNPNKWIDFEQKRSQLGPDENKYMDRRQLLGGKIGHWTFQLRLHHIYRADSGRDPHNHPFRFLTFILMGGYIEEIVEPNPDGSEYAKHTLRTLTRFSLAWCPKHRYHRIDLLLGEVPTVTLVLALSDDREQRAGEWGFLKDGQYQQSAKDTSDA